MEIVPKPRVGGLTIVSTIDVTHNTLDYDSPQERMLFFPQKVEDLDAFSFCLDRHAVIIYRDSVFFSTILSGSRKVAIVGSAFEVTHEFSLEQRQIQGNSGDISCPA